MATPLMNLNLPTVGVTIGPTWASLINTALETIDSHDHSSGKGSQVPTNGININADLPFGAYNATAVKSIRYSSQAGALSGANDKECIYSVNGSLYYNNSAGTAIQITSGSGINIASVGTIGGDYGGVGVTASVTYTNATKIFSFLQAAASAAKIAAGDFIMYESATATNPVTLKSPASLAAAYSVTFPAAVPASTKIIRMTSAGVLQNDLDVDNSSLEISGSSIRVKASGVTSAMANFTAPTIQTFTTGSGTYTTPAGAKWLRVRMAGGGGGGSGSGTADGTAAGAGGSTTFGTRTASGGAGASTRLSAGAGVANSGSGYTVLLSITGGQGQGGSVHPTTANGTQIHGGSGGMSILGNPAGGASAGSGGLTPQGYGAGGNGAGGDATNGLATGSGGGGGGYLEFYVTGSLSATYSYSVGSGGTAGGAGTLGRVGGAGSGGVIIVEEFYQ